MKEKTAILIGGAGFTGSALTTQLRTIGYIVYNVIRVGSPHRNRLDESDTDLHILECELNQLITLKDQIPDDLDVMFYIAWTAGKGYCGQFENILFLNKALELAAETKCRRVVITGSQAEYGVVPEGETIVEDRKPAPFTDYGAVKTAAGILSRQYAKDLGLEWIWGRVFSLIGKNEPETRMLPALFYSLQKGKSFALSSCRQNWDYLDVYDAADALIALAEKGHAGEIYNIANGAWRPLREYTDELRNTFFPEGKILYGEDPDPFISLQPSVEKIRLHTGWKPKKTFLESVKYYQL